MRLDLADAFVILGSLLTIGGVALVYVPAAVILTGLLMLAVVLLNAPRRPR